MEELKQNLKISRDPNEQQIENGGSFVKNFSSWKIVADGEEIWAEHLIDAATPTADGPGILTWLLRDEEGLPITEDGEPQTKVTEHESVELIGKIPACTACSEDVRKGRQGGKWWIL